MNGGMAEEEGIEIGNVLGLLFLEVRTGWFPMVLGVASTAEDGGFTEMKGDTECGEPVAQGPDTVERPVTGVHVTLDADTIIEGTTARIAQAVEGRIHGVG